MAVTGRSRLISEKEVQFQLQPQGPSASLGALQTVSYVAWELALRTFDGLAFEVNRMQEAIPIRLQMPIEPSESGITVHVS